MMCCVFIFSFWSMFGFHINFVSLTVVFAIHRRRGRIWWVLRHFLLYQQSTAFILWFLLNVLFADSESSDEDEDLPLPVGITGNGRFYFSVGSLVFHIFRLVTCKICFCLWYFLGTIEAKVDAPTASKPKAAKPESSAKPKVTVVEPEEDDDSDEDDSDDDSDDEVIQSIFSILIICMVCL